MKDIFADCIGFDWDDGISEKNWILHQVSRNECEQVFFNAPIIVGDDTFHSQSEKSWFLLGKLSKFIPRAPHLEDTSSNQVCSIPG